MNGPALEPDQLVLRIPVRCPECDEVALTVEDHRVEPSWTADLACPTCDARWVVTVTMRPARQRRPAA